MRSPFEIVLATGNPGKVAEMQELLSRLPVKLRTLNEFGEVPDVVEDRDTLEGNAEKKAREIADYVGLAALADDTGLEVDALDGRPGVYSARYAGTDGDAEANREKLLDELDGEGERSAQFRTSVCLILDGKIHRFDGVCRGRIIHAERGEGGFGYDALFVPEDHERTFAEMSPDEKNAISHRGRALRKVAAFLDSYLTGGER